MKPMLTFSLFSEACTRYVCNRRWSISAREFCVAMHLAGQAGIHECLPYGKREGHPSGHYMRHVKDKLPTATYQGQLYNLEAPAFAPADSGPMRGVHKLTCCLPHEVMDADSSDGASLKLDEAIESGGLPPAIGDIPLYNNVLKGSRCHNRARYTWTASRTRTSTPSLASGLSI